jgi:Asp-tRNA(Asn)/Glu-tRNA(Gln) amidotransferase A subunit family amidase
MRMSPAIGRVADEAGAAADAMQPPVVALPVRERLRLIRTGALSSAEWHAEADEWSRAADARYRACVELRPASPGDAPVRLGVKDTVDVAGFATRLGLRRYRHHPQRSAAPLRGLSGVTVNAKVVTTELNIGLGSGCTNPYFPHIDPAGSSTGSGVAVAAGICDLALGTDVLGSIRWPAGRCGVVGLRVTHDPRLLDGVFPLSPAMDAPGWVARTADDLAVLWSHAGLGDPAPARRCRVGVIGEALAAGPEPAILGAMDTARAALAEAGHAVTDVRLGELWRWRGAAWDLCARDAWEGHKAWRERIADDLLDSTRRALETGAQVADRRYAEIDRAMRRLRAALPEPFAGEQVDAWLLPLDPEVPRVRDEVPRAASTIPLPGEPDYDREVGFTPLASFLGLPAITFPVGCDPARGAPLALQLVGPRHTEATLIQLAADIARGVGDLGFVPRW